MCMHALFLWICVKGQGLGGTLSTLFSFHPFQSDRQTWLPALYCVIYNAKNHGLIPWPIPVTSTFEFMVKFLGCPQAASEKSTSTTGPALSCKRHRASTRKEALAWSASEAEVDSVTSTLASKQVCEYFGGFHRCLIIGGGLGRFCLLVFFIRTLLFL